MRFGCGAGPSCSIWVWQAGHFQGMARRDFMAELNQGSRCWVFERDSNGDFFTDSRGTLADLRGRLRRRGAPSGAWSRFRPRTVGRRQVLSELGLIARANESNVVVLGNSALRGQATTVTPSPPGRVRAEIPRRCPPRSRRPRARRLGGACRRQSLQRMRSSKTWFLILGAVCVVGPYLLGVGPRSMRERRYIAITLAFLAWVLLLMASLGAT